MREGYLVLEWALAALAWICALNAVLAAVLLTIYTLQNPPGWWTRLGVPDYVPPDWSVLSMKGGGAEDISPR